MEAATQEAAADYPAATMTPQEAPTDSGAGYELVRGLVYDTVYKFQRRYGGEVDELTGEAHLAFVKCHDQFITGKTRGGKANPRPYAVEIRLWVWYTLFDKLRHQLKRNAIATFQHIGEGQDFPAQIPEFNTALWVRGLGEDARLAVDLVLNPPKAIYTVAEAKGGEPRNYRSTVRAYLQDDLGWTGTRVKAAFDEIRKALG